MRTVALYEMLFGITTLTLGVLGFVETESMISLVVGAIAGIILLFAGLKMQKGSRSSLYTALIVTLGLLGNFGMHLFFKGAAFYPAGVMTTLSLLSLILIILILVQPTERKRIF